MSLRELAKADVLSITSNENEFGLAMTFTTPGDDITVNVVGIESKTSLAFNFETGEEMNAQKVRVSVSEGLFINADYPVRNAAGKVSMKNHKVQYEDSTGTMCYFEVLENFPDETLGLIGFILGQRSV